MKLFPFLIACLLLPALALAYSGTLSIGDVATEGNSSGYNITLSASTIATSGNSSNYAITVQPYDYDAEKNIVVVTPPPDDGGSSSSGGGSSSYFDFGTVAYPEESDEPVIVSSSFSSLTSSVNGSLTITTPKEDTAITTLLVSVGTEQKNVQVRVVETAGEVTRDELVSFTGSWYKLIDVEHESLSNDEITGVDFNFRIAKSWLTNLSLVSSDVILFRYEGGAWAEYATKEVDEDDLYYYFSSDVPGLSTFIIGSKKTAVPVKDVVEEVVQETNEVTGAVVDDTATTSVPTEESDPYAQASDKTKSHNWIFIIVLVLVGGAIGVVVYLNKHKLSTSEKEKVILAAGSHDDSSPAAWTESNDISVQQPQEVTQLPVDTPIEQSEEVVQTPPVEDFVEQQPVVNQPVEQPVEEKTVMPPVEQAPEGLFNNDDEEVLTSFLKGLKEKGVDLNQYKMQLLQHGWTESQVDYCIAKLI